jgi:xanthine dehydrogenase accessory factor
LDVADSSHELQFDTQILTLDETIPAPIHLVIGGGGDIARELLHQARRLGWRTTLIDPRSAIAQQTLSHASADQHLAGWPNDVWESVGIDERAACIACAHEVHLDEPFLARALAGDAMYVGAVGSRKVQHERRGALASLVDDTHLARLRGPAGIDLGGHAAAEIALAIAAEILAVSNKREGAPLSSSTGPIRAT